MGVYRLTVLVLAAYCGTLTLYLLVTEGVCEGKVSDSILTVCECVLECNEEGASLIEVVILNTIWNSLPVSLHFWENPKHRFQTHFVKFSLVVHVAE